ncbi:PTS system, mannitol-specific IIB component / PTS system, mannitol-specific IIC component [Lachnospiraceae bacterium TWA4]|nr:PTS system, mannitol-specific IIB component / PTS system, mannitol-specific IIC component [Lachnospiraceae bacterium TWA4]
MKEKVQSFGRFLSGMVMPNIGAFIAWGFLTALFIEAGWLPNADLATIVSPMLTYIIPSLIAYQGGKMVAGDRGAVIAVIATIGVICGTSYTMLIGAMIMGPLAGLVIKLFDKAVDGKIPAGFEMLVNNFSVGLLGLAMLILGYYFVGPFMAVVLTVLQGGVQILVDNGLLPLISIFVEPAKVLFLNNAINQGIFTPLGIEDVKNAGQSIFYMIETNPGAGAGVLLAYCFFSKDKISKDSAPGAFIIHFFGGIHEIFFPYVLMNPILLLATIAGSVSAMFYNTIFGLGLVGPASPGSIIAYVAMAPKGKTLLVIGSALVSTVVSFVVAAIILKATSTKGSLEDASNQMKEMKAASKGQNVAQATSSVKLTAANVSKIIFACDAGMGSSAMGATVLKKKLQKAGLDSIEVDHASVSDIPAGTQIVVTHRDLQERARTSAPDAKLVLITNFMAAPEYDELVNELKGN